MTRKIALILLLAVVLVVGLGWGIGRITAPRQSGVRLEVQARLATLGQAVTIYSSPGPLPSDLAVVTAGGLLSDDIAREFVYVGGPEVIAFQAEPCRAVARGEPWGGPGETAPRDIPTARAVLYADGRIDWVEEPRFQGELRPLLAPADASNGS